MFVRLFVCACVLCFRVCFLLSCLLSTRRGPQGGLGRSYFMSDFTYYAAVCAQAAVSSRFIWGGAHAVEISRRLLASPQ